MPGTAFVVEWVDAQVVRPLRRAVLRPGQPAANSSYSGDDDPRSAHAAVFAPASTPPSDAGGSGEGAAVPVVVAVGTVLLDAAPWGPERLQAWRVRGMATAAEWRGQGLGTTVLAALVEHAGVQGGALVWCNARVPARRLYERAGFAARGKVFDIPGIGPHVRMWRALPDDPS